MTLRPLTSRRGLIVGAADEPSIMWACASRASALGARVVIGCLDERSAVVLAPLAKHADVSILACNVKKRGALEAMVSAAADQLSGFDFVVHSSVWAPCTDPQGLVTGSDLDGLLGALRASCHSFAELARLCGPHMLQGGAMVTTNVRVLDESVPPQPVHWQVNVSLESIVRYLAMELEPWGIRVHAVSPGPAPNRAARDWTEVEPLMLRAPRNALSERRFTRNKIGDCVAFLIGPAATNLTGQIHYVDNCAHSVQ